MTLPRIRLKAPPFNSLKARLLLWVIVPTALISVVDLIVSYGNADHIATLAQDQLLKGASRIIAEQLEKVGGSYEINVPPAAFELFANEYHDRVYFAVRSKSGLLIAGDSEVPVETGAMRVEEEKYGMSAIRGEPVRVVAYKQSIPSTDNDDYSVTQVAQTLRRHDAFRSELFLQTMRQHLVLLTIVALGLVVAFRWIVSPFLRFGAEMKKRQPGSLEKFDVKHVPTELLPVIAAMNDYVARLDNVLTSYEQFVTNTAHQLRTSFAVLTSQINFAHRDERTDPAQNEVLQAIRKTVRQSTRVVNQLLVLAAVEQNRHNRNRDKPIPLAGVIKAVMEELAVLAHQKQIDLGIDELDETPTVQASQTLLRELVSNLVDNAIQHIEPGGVVTVSCRQQGKAAMLRVVDNGPGIPEAERDKVFQRFYRLDDSKPNSSGLGLSIVKEICNGLGAEISLRSPESGSGLLAEVTFPVAHGASVTAS